MRRLIDRIPFATAILFVPLAYALHHLEEMIYGVAIYGEPFRAWRLRHFPDNNYLTTENMLVNLTIVYLTLIIIFHLRRSKITALVVMLMAMTGELQNVIYHVVCSILFNDLSPGMITAVFVYAPVSALYLYRAFEEGWIDGRTFGVLFVLSFATFWSMEFVGVQVVSYVTPLLLLAILMDLVFGSRFEWNWPRDAEREGARSIGL